MYSFGRRPPRAIQSFGVSSLLGKECRVFYVSLFSSCHLGRISDLLAARLHKLQTDEFRLRAVLLYTFFEAYQAYQRENPREALPEPLTLECGVDSEKTAVGISFVIPEGTVFDFAKTEERIRSGKHEGSFEELLSLLFRHAQRVMVRSQPAVRKMEVITLFGTPGRMDEATLKGPPAIEFVTVEEEALADQTKAQEYIELGDLDYAELLKKESPGKAVVSSPTGDILYQSFKPDKGGGTETESVRVSGKEGEEETATRVSGEVAIAEEEILVKDSASKEQIESTRIAGVTENRQDDVFQVAGGAKEAEAKEFRIRGVTEQIQDETLVVRDEAETAAEAGVESETTKEEGEEEGRGGLFKKIWPFNKKKEATQESDSVEEGEEEAVSSVAEGDGDEDGEHPVLNYGKSEGPKGDAGDAEEASAPAVEVDLNSLEVTLKKAEVEAVEIKKEITSSRAKRWVEGLLGELVAEKSRLQDFSKKMTLSLRQKEVEYKNKERGLKEDIKRRDEIIRQKNYALVRTKEQLAQMNFNLEKAKAVSKRPTEDVHLKQKYLTLQRILTTTKEENVKLGSRIEELRTQLNSAQYNTKVRGPSFNDFSALQSRLERTNRQLEDQKRLNLQMDEKMNIVKRERESTVGNMEGLKRRLEEMSKVAAGAKDAEKRLKLKVEEMLQTELRLRKEVEKVTVEYKKLKGPAGGSGKAGGQAA